METKIKFNQQGTMSMHIDISNSGELTKSVLDFMVGKNLRLAPNGTGDTYDITIYDDGRPEKPVTAVKATQFNGNEAKAKRILQGYSVHELAGKLSVNKQFIYRLETSDAFHFTNRSIKKYRGYFEWLQN